MNTTRWAWLVGVILVVWSASGCVQATDDPPGDTVRPDPNNITFNNANNTSTTGTTGGNNTTTSCRRLTLAYYAPEATSVWVTGSFTEWAETPEAGAIALTNDGAGSWSTTVTLPDSQRHIYKFIINGAEWVADPTNPASEPDGFGGTNSVLDPCRGTSGNNTSNNTSNNGSNNTSGPPCDQVTFRLSRPGAASVWVTGTFTDWAETPEAGALALADDGAGQWSLTTTLPRGRQLYKLIINGAEWISDPNNPSGEPDGFGGTNSVIDVCSASGGGGGACGDVGAFDWRDAVMYFAMIDRFHDGDGQRQTVDGATDGPADGASGQYMGGDLRGLTDKVGYLSDLGVTALWLSAPYNNREWAGAAIDPNADPRVYSGYHGYWPAPDNIDYSDPQNPSPRPRVEERIGTDAELKGLISAAHSAQTADGHGMKVLFDYVMNHVDVDSGLYKAHNDWFARRDGRFALCGPENLWDDPYWGTRCAFTDYLPPFDFDNAAARQWSVRDALWWAREYQIDGYRLDAIKHVSLDWLLDLRRALNAEITSPPGGRFYLVGETFAYDNRDLLKFYVDPNTKLDGQFDFPFKARLCEGLFRPEGSLQDFAGWMDDNDRFYGAGALMTTWIGNHDIPRPIHFASGQIGSCREGSSPGNGWASASFLQPQDAAPYERLGLAFAVMMTSPGIPLIYYGDEIGLAGGGDPDNRRMMEWDDARLNDHQKALRDRVRRLARIRAEHKAASRGQRTTLYADRDVWVYRMSGDGCGPALIVAVNRSETPRDIDVPAGAYTDLMYDNAFPGGSYTLNPRGFAVLRAE